MQSAPLSFSFSSDHQVVLLADNLICGPEATIVGLREARRRAARPLTVTRVSAQEFETALSGSFQNDDETVAEDQLVFDVEGADGPSGQPRDLLEDAVEAPVIELVNQLLRRTIRARASDLHVEPYEGGLRARMRVDGMLQSVLDRSDLPVRRVVSRLKVMAGLDIAETRLPQDGRIALRLGNRAIDVRVSTLPGNYGERVVLRVLDRSAGLLPLEELGLNAAQVAQLTQLAEVPNGIMLSTGPTGSGKTTTLYSLLQIANREERNIVTVEDPIEYDLPGISQSQINTEIGMTFAAGLRATLRQDPDVILVGEIRDTETARVAAQAALTGHLVFSTLHANGSVASIVRLRDLELDNFLIASTLRGVIAQRLVRRLCRSCRLATPINNGDRKMFADNGLIPPETLLTPIGCDQCAGTGYSGRVGVFEIAIITEKVRQAIDQGATEAQLKELAVPTDGTLLAQGLALTASGDTSLAEVARVIGDNR